MALTTLGQIVATPAALKHLERNSISPLSLITRHKNGDWGDLTQEDVKANEMAIASGGRILSMYPVADRRLYCITEADYSSTCLLCADEY